MTSTIVAVGALSACGSEMTGSVVVSGSSTVEPITVQVAERFNDADPTVDLVVDGPGTGDGFELFCDGEIDINDASSRIEPEQIETCEANGVEFVELQIANDGIATMTHESNDAVTCLALADVYALVGPESERFVRWDDANELAQELDGRDHLPDLPLSVIGPGEESGTFTSFVDLAIKGFAEDRGEFPTTRADYQASSDDNVILQGVQGSPTGFGWTGFAFAREADGVRLIEVDGGAGCVAPTDSSIASGSYPLSRPLFLYVGVDRLASNPSLRAFVDFYLSDAGIAAVADVGYVPLTADALEATRQTWAVAAEAAT